MIEEGKHEDWKEEPINSVASGVHYHRYFKGVKLDPFRIAKIYGMDAIGLTILKKTIATGKRGYKDAKQDYLDIIGACNRAIEMMEEDEND